MIVLLLKVWEVEVVYEDVNIKRFIDVVISSDINDEYCYSYMIDLFLKDEKSRLYEDFKI